MDFATMKTRAYAVIRDQNRAFVLESEVADWLNEGNLELARRLRSIRGTPATGSTVSGTATIALPNDFLEALTLDIAGKKVEFVQDLTMDTRQAIGGTPSFTTARIFGSVIELFPVPTSALAWTLRYVKKPATLVNAGDTSELPESLHTKVVNYARAHALYKAGEPDQGDRYFAMFEAGLPEPGSDVIPRVPLQPSQPAQRP